MPADPKLVKSIFLAAVEKAKPEERAAFLAEACGGDEELRRRTEELLRAHDVPGGLPGIADRENPAGPSAASAAQPVGEAADLSFLAPPSEPGSLGRLDHYEVLDVVGRGGAGIVLRARDTKLLRVVALKVLAAPLAASGSARQRFVREARAAAAVRDDHVVAIHAVEDQGTAPYLVMEFIDGCTLEALVRRDGPLDAKEVLRIGIQAANGLAAAHKLGLIHRDVKPANILLENGVQRVKLTDFGLARAADDASLTQSGLIAGTPLYMAPEQANGDPIDARADLFSLGSVLYELCAGRPAFRAANTVAVIKRVSDDTPRPLREINPDVPEALCRVIGRLQAKKPADRPASAREVSEQLAALLASLQGQSPAPRPVHTAAPKRMSSPRPWVWAAAALVMFAVTLGAGEATGFTRLAGTVVRLFSPEGTLVVEVDDPAVSVTVDGADMVITGAGAKEIRLKPGRYRVEASKDGKVVREELVTVNRDGRRVVRISQEVGPSAVERLERAAAERWERTVAAMPAEQQFKAVVRRLREMNPAFDGTVTPTIENGVVAELKFITDDVDDISPLRALRGLERLECSGSPHKKGKVSDLTPLRGLALKKLTCNDNPIADLGPLRGMPLAVVNAPDTLVSDLSPLTGMRLEVLTLQRTGVSNLSPLAGMPLRWLDVAWVHGISDLGPLRDMPLEYLNLTALPVSDIALLASLKSMKYLILDSMPVSDLSPLHGLQLLNLSIREIRAKDLSPLAGMPLRSLRFDYRSDREQFVRSFKVLEVINDKPAADFWKEAGSK